MARLRVEELTDPDTPKGGRFSRMFRSPRTSSPSPLSNSGSPSSGASPMGDRNRLRKGFAKVGLFPSDRASMDTVVPVKKEPIEKEAKEPKSMIEPLPLEVSPVVAAIDTSEDVRQLDKTLEHKREAKGNEPKVSGVATTMGIESADEQIVDGEASNTQQPKAAELDGEEITMTYSKNADIDHGTIHEQHTPGEQKAPAQVSGGINRYDEFGMSGHLSSPTQTDTFHPSEEAPKIAGKATYRPETVAAIMDFFDGNTTEEKVQKMIIEDGNRATGEDNTDKHSDAASLHGPVRNGSIEFGRFRITNPEIVAVIDRLFCTLLFVAWTLAALRGPLYLMESVWRWSIAITVLRLASEELGYEVGFSFSPIFTARGILHKSAGKFGYIWGEVLAVLVEGYKEGYDQIRRGAGKA